MAQFRFVGLLLLLGSMFVGQSLNSLAADNRLQILNFTMDRCEPCRAMQPVLAKLIMEGWQIRQIDVAQEPQLTAQFKLQSAPTIVVLSDGREVDRVVGAIAYNKLLNRLEAASRSAVTASRPSTPTAPPNLTLQEPARGQLTRTGVDEPSMVRGQSPGPSAVPDLDVDDERMLEFVMDLPEPPKLPALSSVGQPANFQLANSQLGNSQAPNYQAPGFQNPNYQPQTAQTSNVQLASTSASLGRSAVPPQNNQADIAFSPQVDPVTRAQQGTVRIRIEDANSIAFGTGTVIYVHNGQALVLTCGHMFRDLGKNAQMSIDVFDKSGRLTNVPAQFVSRSTDEGDIGLMEFRCPYPITPVPIAKRPPAIGDAAFSFGCDRGADPTRRDTQVKRINRYLGPANVEIHGAPVVGRSGGGLFNAQGQLIGVCNAADAEDDEGIYAALPVIDQHVAALRLESLPSDEHPTPSSPVQVASTTSNAGGMSPIQTAQSSVSQATLPQAVLPQAVLPQASAQVRCVIRDAQGKETALLIDRPSEELVALLRQSAVR